ncbi:MAG: tRNA lysidine(34) synthetase TilS [Actinomycetaceae bacterium]
MSGADPSPPRAPRVSGPATLAARAAVTRSLADLPAGTRLLVACSGGPDSLALAVTVAHASAAAGWVPRALVVDHGLREGSAAEARAVVARRGEIGLPGAAVRVRPDGGGGPENRAREARWAALRAGANGDLVLTGHTMDDQAETVLLGLARGSGARSLAGMRERDDDVRRPFLRLRRAQTLAVCEELGLEPVLDPTNAADGPWRASDGSALRRAAVRDRALPALADALGVDPVPALARTAALHRRDDDELSAQAECLLADAAAAARPPAGAGPADPAGTAGTHGDAPGAGSGVEGGGRRETDEPRADVILDAATLAAAPAAIRTRALRSAGALAGWRPGDVKAAHVEGLDALVAAYSGQGPLALPGIEAWRSCGRLILGPRDD